MSTINNIVKQLNKEFKTEIVQVGTELKRQEMIPFSSPKLNYLTRGGIAEGKVAEFFGKEGSGKTTSALDLIGNFQKKYPKRIVLFLDAENTVDAEWGIKMGVNWDNVILIKPEEHSAEQLLDIVLTALRSGDVGLVIVDSIPALMPEAELKGDLEDKHYAGNSAVMTQFIRKAVATCNQYNSTLVMINQLRDVIGKPYQAYDTPGGRALKHSYSQRLQFTKGRLLDEKGNEVSNNYESPQGNLVKTKLEKNKVTKNDRKFTTYTLDYEIGIDHITDTIDLGIYLKVINQAGAWYDVTLADGTEIKKQGKPNFIKHFKENEKQYNEVRDRVNEEALK